MFKIRAKSTLMALVLAIAAMLFAMGGIGRHHNKCGRKYGCFRPLL